MDVPRFRPLPPLEYSVHISFTSSSSLCGVCVRVCVRVRILFRCEEKIERFAEGERFKAQGRFRRIKD